MGVNSLSDLNSYGNEQITLTDDRDFGVTITGDLNSSNAINASEGDTLSLVWNQTLSSIVSADSSNNVSIEVDFSAAIGPQFNWGSLPAGVTSSEPQTDVYKVVGIQNVTDFNTVLTGATCEIVDQEAAFAYTVKVIYDVGAGAVTYTTTNNITITTTYQELNVPATAWSGTQTMGTTVNLTGDATVTDTETGASATYTAKVKVKTSEITSLTSTGSGGSASSATESLTTLNVDQNTSVVAGETITQLNSGATGKVIQSTTTATSMILESVSGTFTTNSADTLTGSTSGALSRYVTSISTDGTGQTTRTITGTLTQVNSHFADLSTVLSTGYGSGTTTIIIRYELVNNLSGVNSTGSQTGDVVQLIAWTNDSLNRAYTENTINTNIFSSNPPQITAAVDSTFGDGSYKVRLNVQDAYANPYSGGYGTTRNRHGWFRDSGSGSVQAYQILEKTDTVSNLNTWLSSNIEYIPPPAESGNQTISLTLYRTSGGGGEVVPTTSITVQGTANAAAVSGAGTTTYSLGQTSAQSITDNMRFFLACDVLIVAGGGHGGHGNSTSDGAGGGGAGELTYVRNNSLFTGGRDGLTTFDITVGDAASSWNGTPTYGYSAVETNSHGTNIIKAMNGGQGGTAHTGPGGAGAAGGNGGGGGYGTTPGAGGAVSQGGMDGNITSYLNATPSTPSALIDLHEVGNAAESSGGLGGDGGGQSYTTDISGSSVTYAYPGKGGNQPGTKYSTIGSGGHGGEDGSNTGRTAGQNGVVIIKLYEFS